MQYLHISPKVAAGILHSLQYKSPIIAVGILHSSQYLHIISIIIVDFFLHLL
jgi:hypothetical protein